MHGAPDIDARIADVTQFIGQTQSRFDDIERRMIAFTELKARLGALQARLVPLESGDSGVVKLVTDLQGILADMRKDAGGFVATFERARAPCRTPRTCMAGSISMAASPT